MDNVADFPFGRKPYASGMDRAQGVVGSPMAPRVGSTEDYAAMSRARTRLFADWAAWLAAEGPTEAQVRDELFATWNVLRQLSGLSMEEGRGDGR